MVPDLSSVEEWLADNEVLDPESPTRCSRRQQPQGLFRRWRRR
jgi:hypothetical protein